jgi:hypothetical protein
VFQLLVFSLLQLLLLHTAALLPVRAHVMASSNQTKGGGGGVMGQIGGALQKLNPFKK